MTTAYFMVLQDRLAADARNKQTQIEPIKSFSSTRGMTTTINYLNSILLIASQVAQPERRRKDAEVTFHRKTNKSTFSLCIDSHPPTLRVETFDN